MSIFLHVGQCGNQLGEAFWRRSMEDYSGVLPGSCPLFHEDGKAACVLVDSESKVVNRFRSSMAGAIREENICLDSSGRANNWAMGFQCSAREVEQERGLMHSVVEAVRHENERMDSLQSLVLFHSLAGGTGSGVGSALLQYMRDACPSLNIVTVSVGPFSSGECPTQWYNAAFSAQYLTELADAVIYRDNDSNVTHCAKASTSSSSSPNPLVPVTMGRLNEAFAADLASALFPLAGSSRSGGSQKPFNAAGLARSCCPFRYAKFLEVRSTWSVTGGGAGLGSSRPPRPGGLQPEWGTIVKTLTASLPTRDLNDMPITTLAAQVCLRGLTAAETRPLSSKQVPPPSNTRRREDLGVVEACARGISRAMHMVTWQEAHQPPQDVWCSMRTGSHCDRAAAVCANRTHIGPVLSRIGVRCNTMLEERAYQHWYSKYGVEDDDFVAALESLMRVREEYRVLSRASEPPDTQKESVSLRRIRDMGH